MELKFVILSETSQPAPSFNRTFMELKWASGIFTNSLVVGFNRTFMELKYTTTRLMSFLNNTVLIVPLWNWNNYYQ